MEIAPDFAGIPALYHNEHLLRRARYRETPAETRAFCYQSPLLGQPLNYFFTTISPLGGLHKAMADSSKFKQVNQFFKSVKLIYIILALLILAVLALRLALPGMVRNYVNKKLNELPGYTGHVDDIDIHLIRGAYAINGLLLKKKTDPANYPFLRIGHTDLSIEWGALFKGRLVGVVALDTPVIHIFADEDISREPSKSSWTATVKALMPININRLQVDNGTFAYLDLQKKPGTGLHIGHLHLTALNLQNVEDTGDPLPSTVSLTGTSIGNGRLKGSMKANVLKEIPNFNAGLQLTRVNLPALNGFLEAELKFDVERGDIDIFSRLKLKDSEMDGFIKPFISNLKVLDVKKDIKKKGGILRVAKKAVIGLFAEAVKNPKTKKIATVIPIKGNLKDLKTNGWATFTGILKNAFVRAFHESISNEAIAGWPAPVKK